MHRSVNHKAGEFSRMERIFGQDVNVTTNAVEGLFGRNTCDNVNLPGLAQSFCGFKRYYGALNQS